MSGVLKTIGSIALITAAVIAAPWTGGASLLGLGAWGAGFAATALTIVGVTASIGASLLAQRPGSAPVTSATTDRLNANIDVRTGRKSWVGETALQTDLRP
jgi:hypothetical protein